jgi:hypothetical protein
MTVSKGIGRGGKRLGAGRKPKGQTEEYDLDRCLNALAKALEGKPAFLFIETMRRELNLTSTHLRVLIERSV